MKANEGEWIFDSSMPCSIKCVYAKIINQKTCDSGVVIKMFEDCS